MVGAEERTEESGKRAELFETLAHQTRIRILQALESQSMSFAELKRTLGMESSGNLQHHLGKLGNLVKQTEDGKYAITDDAKEALRLVGSIEQKPAQTGAIQVESSKTRWSLFSLALVSALLLTIVVYEYSLIMKSIPLFDDVGLSENALNLFGEKYAYLALTTTELQNGTRVTFDGAVFTYVNRSRYSTEEGMIPISARSGLLNISGIPASLVYPRYFRVEFEDGEVETIPIMSWSARLYDWYGQLVTYGQEQPPATLSFVIFDIHSSRALAFDVGPRTIMLLVKSNR